MPLGDPIAAMIVATIIALNAIGLFRDNLSFLLGRSPGPEYLAEVEKVARSVQGVLEVRDLRQVCWAGRCKCWPPYRSSTRPSYRGGPSHRRGGASPRPREDRRAVLRHSGRAGGSRGGRRGFGDAAAWRSAAIFSWSCESANNPVGIKCTGRRSLTQMSPLFQLGLIDNTYASAFERNRSIALQIL
jgi:hypothetical protein